MKVILVFIAIFILFSGCGSQKRVVVAETKEYPLWYLKPPKTDTQILYSVGDGQTKEDAIANALSMMVSTLSVSISSEFNSKSIIKEGSSSSNTATYTNEVQSEVKRIHISNYELLNSQSMGYKQHIVLIKSDKKMLFDGLKKEIEQKFSLIEKQKFSVKNTRVIKQISAYKSFKESLKDVPNSLMVMSTLDNSFDDNSYIDKIQKVDEELSRLIWSLSFGVKANKSASNLVSSVKKALSAKRLKIQDKSGANHFKIYIESNIEKTKSYGFTLARSAIDITIKDYKGIVIGSNKLDIIGQSTQGYDIALQNVAFKFNAIIEKEGIEKVIGLKI